MRARYYDSTTGEFLTLDPLLAQTREAYGYVNGDTVNRTDPSGLACLEFWDASKV
jgi:RHS repeat-associated protein